MYSDIDNQAMNLARYGFSFIIIYVLWPRILFKGGGGGLDGFISRYVRMVCLTIAIGYVLVMVKLYEVASLAVVLLLLSARGAFTGPGRKNNAKELWEQLIKWIYDFLDGMVHPARVAAGWWRERARSLKGEMYYRFGTFANAGSTLLFASVILFSAYLRFYDAVVHAAPAMSDAYVTLAWMKYVERRILFHDGIYPQGFHIYLSILHKFAANDPLYILKYTGPLNGVFAAIGLYFAASRFTGQKVPGIIAAFVFGVLSSFLPIQWERQASTNSQEFALVFLLPAWYFAASYLKTSKKVHLWTAGACFLVIGWVHAIIFAFLGIGLFLLIAVHLLLNYRESIRPCSHISLAGVLAGALSAFPAVVGLLMGRKFHGSSTDYIAQEMQINFPDITLIDQAALVGIAIFFVISVLAGRSRKEAVVPLFFLLLGMASFVMYVFLGPLTGKAILSLERTGQLWSLMASMGVGLGWFAAFRLVPGGRRKQAAEMVLCLGLMACVVLYLKPAPAEPYKMQRDSMVEQYLRISQEFRPTEWMIVSAEEGYALVLGRGWHLMLGDFLAWYDPESRRLARNNNGRAEVLSTQDIFIFKEKNVLRVNVAGAEKTLEEIYQRRVREYGMLDRWAEKYGATHGNMSIYYEDPDIQVIRIHQPKSREEEFRDIWEGREQSGKV